METDHPQVPFQTFYGSKCKVDEDMFDILTELKRLGVETQFSCQESEHGQQAYVCSTGKTMTPLLRHMWWMFKVHSTLQTDEWQTLRWFFLSAYREYEWNWFLRPGMGKQRGFEYSTGHRGRKRVQIERGWSNVYGWRITLRWPSEMNQNMLDLLRAIR